MQRNQGINETTNFKQYFLEEDNLRSVQNEVIFSVLRRYNCFAGCHICYVDKYFEKDKSKFQRFVPTEISKETTDKWVDIFSNYAFANTVDDLYWMKNQQPHLFNWYKEHAGLFHFGSMTDNNFIRAWDILTNEIEKPKGIYEFTFSDKWLAKIKDEGVIARLNEIHKMMPIALIKIIQTDLDSLQWEPVKKIVDWMKANGVEYGVHHDIKTFDTILLKSHNQRQSFASFKGDVTTVCGEADYLQYDSFFLNLIDAIDPNVTPYDTLDSYSLESHLPKHLNAKKEVYSRYVTRLGGATDKINVAYRNYFQWVTEHLKVNEEYNFIPTLSLKPFHNYSMKLVESGWQNTNYGLFKPATTVTSLYELS